MAAEFKIDISKPLGCGSYGAVFSGTMTVNGRTTPIAVKRIQNDGKGNVYRENAEKEYNILQQVGKQRNVVKLLHFEYKHDFIYLYMELGDQGNLGEFLNRINPDMHLRVRIMKDCASALSFMHGLTPPIAHRDIKPANVIIQTDGANHIAKLVDFGLSKIVEENRFFMSTDRGTVGYWAPEFFVRGRKQYTHSIDIFSMGLLYLVVFNFDINVEDGRMEPTPAHIKHQNYLPYGQRLLQATDENRPAPELFTEFTADQWPNKDLKTMMMSMVRFNPSERCNMAMVETLLNNMTMLFRHKDKSNTDGYDMETSANVYSYSLKRRKDGELDSENQTYSDGFERIIESDEPLKLDQPEYTFDAFIQLDKAYMKETFDRLRDIEVKFSEWKPKYTKLEIEHEQVKRKNDTLESNYKSLKDMYKAEFHKHIESKKQPSENSTETSNRNDSNSEPCSKCEELETKYNELQRKFTTLNEKFSNERSEHIKDTTDLLTEARTNNKSKCKEIAEVTAKCGIIAAERNQMSEKYEDLKVKLELTQKCETVLENSLQQEIRKFEKKCKDMVEVEVKHKELEVQYTNFAAKCEADFSLKMTKLLREQNSKFQNKCEEKDELENKFKEISALAEQYKKESESVKNMLSSKQAEYEQIYKDLYNRNLELKKYNDELKTKNQEITSAILSIRKECGKGITNLENILMLASYEPKCSM